MRKMASCWRGEIASSDQAIRIIRWTAIGIAAFVAFGVYSLFSDTPGSIGSMLFVAAVALWMLLKYSLWAARLLFGFSILGVGGGLALIGIGLWGRDLDFAATSLIAAILWVVFLLATRRACQAARFLRDQRARAVEA